MKTIHTTVVILIVVQSTAYAQNGPQRSDIDKYWSERGQHFTARLVGATTANGIVDDANKCAPDRAEAVWSATSALIGYSCAPSGSGG
jgi:hypothetical protein